MEEISRSFGWRHWRYIWQHIYWFHILINILIYLFFKSIWSGVIACSHNSHSSKCWSLFLKKLRWPYVCNNSIHDYSIVYVKNLVFYCFRFGVLNTEMVLARAGKKMWEKLQIFFNFLMIFDNSWFWHILEIHPHFLAWQLAEKCEKCWHKCKVH